ncbi:Phloretin 2'-O-glucosyltransferase [Senna tora]|uniref:Phloretin 2'-O-glucosyltransferase n=1 Tax=Senna tora TaxID=362788 RepID=A0A834T096_9FABA|nr:Phloretin 2'-O-glucosyltransferase [Senna tora]
MSSTSTFLFICCSSYNGHAITSTRATTASSTESTRMIPPRFERSREERSREESCGETAGAAPNENASAAPVIKIRGKRIWNQILASLIRLLKLNRIETEQDPSPIHL